MQRCEAQPKENIVNEGQKDYNLQIIKDFI